MSQSLLSLRFPISNLYSPFIQPALVRHACLEARVEDQAEMQHKSPSNTPGNPVPTRKSSGCVPQFQHVPTTSVKDLNLAPYWTNQLLPVGTGFPVARCSTAIVLDWRTTAKLPAWLGLLSGGRSFALSLADGTRTSGLPTPSRERPA